jgi:hypothetical protein
LKDSTELKEAGAVFEGDEDESFVGLHFNFNKKISVLPEEVQKVSKFDFIWSKWLFLENHQEISL